MADIKELIKALKSEEFNLSAKESYYSLTAENEESKVNFEEYLLALKGSFINMYISAISKEEIDNIIDAAQNSDIYAVDAGGIFKLVEATKAKIGDLIYKNFQNKIEEILDYREDSLYEYLENYNLDIVKYIKKNSFYHTINQIKKGNYMVANTHRLSQEEIKMIENVKMIGPINRIIHANYDVSDYIWPHCEYEEIPDDSILKKFAFHTDKKTPLFRIIFKDGTIVEYFNGDPRVLSYNFQLMLILTKSNIVKCLRENDIDDIESLSPNELRTVLDYAMYSSEVFLNTVGTVYTREMIDDSKKRLENINVLVKEYNL